MNSGDLELPKSVHGNSLLMPYLVILFMFLTVITKSEIRAFIFSFITLGLVYITRNEIHFQGFIDHDYDSKTGFGFYLIFVFSIILFLSTTINWLRKKYITLIK